MNDKRDKTDSKLVPLLVTIGSFIGSVIIIFFQKVKEYGRIKEALVTVPLLVGSWYLMWQSHVHEWWIYLIPLVAFSIYWWYVFSTTEKIVPELMANPCWANRNWWWTLDGWSFEQEVAQIFELNGYIVEITKKTGDGGVDLILWKDDIKTIVQCKHYRAFIPVDYVRELNGVREDFRAQRVIMVASSGASSQCYNFIKNKPYFTILNLDDIIALGTNTSSHTP